MSCHLQGSMLQYLLKAKYVTTINKEPGSKGMSVEVAQLGWAKYNMVFVTGNRVNYGQTITIRFKELVFLIL